jgi:4-hydroxy-4-methyl-2-oxoglutarate aldolase
VPEFVARAQRLTTCNLSDAMDRCGIRRGGLVGVRPMEPARPAAGLAFTVELRPAGEAEPAPGNYLDQIGAGQFVVLAAGGRIDYSVWGGNRTIAARRHSAVAAVADGAYRDVEEHRALGFPVYGLAPTPMAGRGHVVVTKIDQPVKVCGLLVNPRDLVAADSSGVVVVPGAQIEVVVTAAEAIAAAEAMPREPV